MGWSAVESREPWARGKSDTSFASSQVRLLNKYKYEGTFLFPWPPAFASVARHFAMAAVRGGGGLPVRRGRRRLTRRWLRARPQGRAALAGAGTRPDGLRHRPDPSSRCRATVQNHDPDPATMHAPPARIAALRQEGDVAVLLQGDSRVGSRRRAARGAGDAPAVRRGARCDGRTRPSRMRWRTPARRSKTSARRPPRRAQGPGTPPSRSDPVPAVRGREDRGARGRGERRGALRPRDDDARRRRL